MPSTKLINTLFASFLLLNLKSAYSFDFSNSIKKLFIPEFESLQDVEKAPKVIKSSARAVFRFEGGTGSFVKHDKKIYIMTNNHVLGFKHCARNGCFAKAVFNYQKGANALHKTLFVTPVAASADVDVSFYEFKEVTSGGDFVNVKPSAVLEFESEEPKVASDVFPIGHPRKSIKKFSSGKIVKFENGYMYVDALTLPGNSGSPIISRDGKIVGIHHSSAKKNDGFTREGLLYVGRASSNLSMLKVLDNGIKNNQEQLAKFLDVNRKVSLSTAKKYSTIYKKSKTIPSLLNKLDFFTALYKDCESRIDMATTHTGKFIKSHDSCTVASSWINCGNKKGEDISVEYVLATTLDDAHPDFGSKAGYCPALKMRKNWANLFLKIGEKYRSFHGKDPLAWTAEALSKLITNSKNTATVVVKNIEAETGTSKGGLNVTNMLRVAKNSESLKDVIVNGIDLKKTILSYKDITGYQYELSKIAQTADQLHNHTHLKNEEFEPLIKTILDEPQLSLNAKLIVEKIAYEKGLL